MPLCPNCGSRQPDGAAFCDECGARLEKPPPPPPPSSPAQHTPTIVSHNCPVCHAPTMPGEAFCENCGAALTPEPPIEPTQPTQVTPPPPPPRPSSTPPPQPELPMCANCGAQLQRNSNFCDMCGAPLSEAESTPPTQSPTAASPPVYTPEPPPPVSSTEPVPPPPPTYPSDTGIPGHLVVQASNATLPFPPGRSEVVIGREDPVSNVFPEIDLTDHGGDEGGVSRKHARIFLQGAQVLIEDLNSTNYTHVNRQRLTPGQPHPLSAGDEIRLGRVKLTYVAP